MVQYYNGTVVEVAKVLGSPEYLEPIERLATTSKASLNPALGFTSGGSLRLVENLPEISSPWRDSWRWLNTKVGRPVKLDEVGIISDLLQQLKVSTEKSISQPLDRVAVTDPGFPSLKPVSNIIFAYIGKRQHLLRKSDSGSRYRLCGEWL